MDEISIIEKEFEQFRNDYIFIIFGSASRDELKASSDIDIFAVEKNEGGRAYLEKLWQDIPKKIGRDVSSPQIWSKEFVEYAAENNDFTLLPCLEGTPIILGNDEDIIFIESIKEKALKKISKNSYKHNLSEAIDLYNKAIMDLDILKNDKIPDFKKADQMFANLGYSIGHFINAISIHYNNKVLSYSNIMKNSDTPQKRVFKSIREYFKKCEESKKFNTDLMEIYLGLVGTIYDDHINQHTDKHKEWIPLFGKNQNMKCQNCLNKIDYEKVKDISNRIVPEEMKHCYKSVVSSNSIYDLVNAFIQYNQGKNIIDFAAKVGGFSEDKQTHALMIYTSSQIEVDNIVSFFRNIADEYHLDEPYSSRGSIEFYDIFGKPDQWVE